MPERLPARPEILSWAPEPRRPRYLRLALVEASLRACCQRTKQRPGEQRGAKIAQVVLAGPLAQASWHMSTGAEPFAATGPAPALAA